jgi:hypothetical protein
VLECLGIEANSVTDLGRLSLAQDLFAVSNSTLIWMTDDKFDLSKGVTELEAGARGINDGEAALIAAAIRFNPILRRLILNTNKIAEEGMKFLGKALEVNSESAARGDLLLTFVSQGL